VTTLEEFELLSVSGGYESGDLRQECELLSGRAVDTIIRYQATERADCGRRYATKPSRTTGSDRFS
jgi:hypothetical protein